jgi:hypothetical protein
MSEIAGCVTPDTEDAILDFEKLCKGRGDPKGVKSGTDEGRPKHDRPNASKLDPLQPGECINNNRSGNRRSNANRTLSRCEQLFGESVESRYV